MRTQFNECPNCGEDEDLCGQEVPELYDGISYWHCLKCGCGWNRWTGEKLTYDLQILSK